MKNYDLTFQRCGLYFFKIVLTKGKNPEMVSIMKYIQTLIAMAVGGAVLALGSSSAVAQSVKPCMVTVVRIQGQARYSLGDNTWHPLVVGKILRAGAIIQSGADSTVDVVLSGNPVAMPQANPSPSKITFAADPNVRGLVAYKPMVQQNVIRMFGNSVLAVDKLTVSDTGVDTVSDTELDLRAGGIFLHIEKMSAMSQFIIKIPDGVAGIRGFIGGIQLDPSGQLVDAATYKGKLLLSTTGSGAGNGAGPGVYTLDSLTEYTPGHGVTPLSADLIQSFEGLIPAVPTGYYLLSGFPYSANALNCNLGGTSPHFVVYGW